MPVKESDVRIIKNANAESVQVEMEKKQPNYDGWVISPIDFWWLEKLYEKSFIVPGILDKVSSTIWNDFVTDNEDIMGFIKKINIKFLYESLEYFGNSFFEVIRDKGGKVVRIEPVITSTMKQLKYGGYMQTVLEERVYFNAFTAKKEERENGKTIWEETGVKPKELAVDKTPWFNPNLNEIYQFKTSHLFNKYYGNSLYQACNDQILLLSQIDIYFSSLFNRGWTGNKIIFVNSENEKIKISPQGMTAIEEQLKNMKGVGNAGVDIVLQAKVWLLDLSMNFDVPSFNAKTEELLKKLSIGLNIPYEVLLSIAGNKATSEQAEENFYNQKIIPLQGIIIKWLQEIVGEDYPFKDLYYRAKDFRNGKEEMDKVTGYVKSKVITQNEARAEIGYDAREDGDVFLDVKDTPVVQNTSDVQKTIDGDISFLKEINESMKDYF